MYICQLVTPPSNFGIPSIVSVPCLGIFLIYDGDYHLSFINTKNRNILKGLATYIFSYFFFPIYLIMSAKICQATTIDNRKCSFKANKKYGDYCGIHKHLYTPPAPAEGTSGAPVPIIETPIIETPIIIAAHLKTIVQYTEKEAENYIKSKNYGKYEMPIEPMYFCMLRARETMDDEQLEIFERNPRANVHIEEQYMEQYQTYKRVIDLYYNTIIPIINRYIENNNREYFFLSLFTITIIDLTMFTYYKEYYSWLFHLLQAHLKQLLRY
jgi:hypothetical protein